MISESRALRTFFSNVRSQPNLVGDSAPPGYPPPLSLPVGVHPGRLLRELPQPKNPCLFRIRVYPEIESGAAATPAGLAECAAFSWSHMVVFLESSMK